MECDLLADYPMSICLPVQWGDQDAFGHVNNTVYFRWFESARIAYLDRPELRAAMPDSSLGPILAAIRCDFRRQVTF
ncbi:MAG: thioesterase family protein, partial [Pirellulales bacterium]